MKRLLLILSLSTLVCALAGCSSNKEAAYTEVINGQFTKEDFSDLDKIVVLRRKGVTSGDNVTLTSEEDVAIFSDKTKHHRIFDVSSGKEGEAPFKEDNSNMDPDLKLLYDNSCMVKTIDFLSTLGIDISLGDLSLNTDALDPESATYYVCDFNATKFCKTMWKKEGIVADKGSLELEISDSRWLETFNSSLVLRLFVEHDNKTYTLSYIVTPTTKAMAEELNLDCGTSDCDMGTECSDDVMSTEGCCD